MLCDAGREARQREFAMKVLGIATGLFGLSIFAMAGGFILAAGLVLAGDPALAQDSQAQTAPQAAGQAGGGQGQRSGWGGGGMMGPGRGTMGTVTEVAADHYTIKTDTGESYTVHFSANTRIMKAPAGGRGPGGGGGARGEGAGGGRAEGGGYSGPPPETLKPTDIKVGDAVMVAGEVDAQAKSVGAVAIFQIDPERAKQMREMQANYGKTWLADRKSVV